MFRIGQYPHRPRFRSSPSAAQPRAPPTLPTRVLSQPIVHRPSRRRKTLRQSRLSVCQPSARAARRRRPVGALQIPKMNRESASRFDGQSSRVWGCPPSSSAVPCTRERGPKSLSALLRPSASPPGQSAMDPRRESASRFWLSSQLRFRSPTLSGNGDGQIHNDCHMWRYQTRPTVSTHSKFANTPYYIPCPQKLWLAIIRIRRKVPVPPF